MMYFWRRVYHRENPELIGRYSQETDELIFRCIIPVVL